MKRRPWPNILYALDLSNSGNRKWTYSPHPSASSQGVACCDVVSRGAAYYKGGIYYNTLDLHTIAVNANTGKELWKTTLGDINSGESITMTPLVVKGKAVVGNSGGEFGVRGWLAVSSKHSSLGLSPLEDQQLGGLIMWIPAGLVYLATGLWIFALWLRESDLSAEEREYAP